MTVQDLHPETAKLLRRIFNGDENSGEISWPDGNRLPQDIFFKDVSAQGMAALLYRRITANDCCQDCPAELLSRLRNVTMQQAAFEMLLEIDLRKALDALAAIGVKPLLLKGTPLSHTLYPAPGLRPRCDTDLLIAESDREQVAALMTRLGYKRLHEAEADFISSQMCFSIQGGQGFTFSYDIHWQISNNNRSFSRKFGDERLFAGSVAIASLGENAWTPNHADALLYACFHRAGHFSHSGDRLVWLYDIHLLAQVLSAEQLSIFCDKARELEIVTLCVDAIAIAKFWFGTNLPQTLELLLQEDATRESSALFLQSGRMDGIKNHALLELKGMSSWRERIHFLLQNVFPPGKYMLWRYDKKQKIVLPWLYCKRLVEGVYIFLRR